MRFTFRPLSVAALFVVLSGTGLLPTAPAAETDPQKVLRLYEQSAAAMTRSSFNFQTNTTYEGDFNFDLMAKSSHITGTINHDGNRRGALIVQDDFRGAGNTPHSSQQVRAVFDKEFTFFQAANKDVPPRNVLRSKDDSQGSEARFSGMMELGMALDGRMLGNGPMTFAEVAGLKGSALTVRDQPETVDGHETVVLEARTPYGKQVMWLDPAQGYQPRRISITKTGSDLKDGKPISEEPKPLPQGSFTSKPHAAIKEYDVLVDKIQIADVGGTPVAVGAEITLNEEYANGRKTTVRATHTRTDVNLNPDFEALKAFAVELPDGTPVRYLDERGNAGVQFVWKGGRPVPAVDEAILARIEEQVAGGGEKPAAGAAVPGAAAQLPAIVPAKPGTPARASNTPLIALAAVVAVAALVALAWIRRRPRAVNL